MTHYIARKHRPARRNWQYDDTIPAQNYPVITGSSRYFSADGLLEHLATITKNTCRHPATGATFPMTTSPNPTQQKALDLLKSINL